MEIKKFTLLTYICAGFCSLLLFLQYQFFFDGSYYTNKGILILLAILFCFLPYVFTRSKDKKLKMFNFEYHNISVKSLAVLSAITTIILFWASFNLYIDYKNALASGELVESATGFSFDVQFLAMTALLAVYHLFFTVAYIVKKAEFFAKYKLFELIPVFWAVFLVIYTFLHHTMSILSLENLYIVLLVSSLLLSLFARARIISKIDVENNSYKKIFKSIGVSTALSIGLFVSTVLGYAFSGYYISFPVEVQFICMALSINNLNFFREMRVKVIRLEEQKVTKGKRFKI